MINHAYQEAGTALDCRLFSRTDQIYTYDDIDDTLKSRIKKMRQYVNALNSAIIKEHVSDQILILWKTDEIMYVLSLLPQLSVESALSLREYLLKVIGLLSAQKYTSLLSSDGVIPEENIVDKAK